MNASAAHEVDLLALLRLAARAPSSHNTQPWIFRVDGRTIDVIADRTRALPVNDAYDRELTMSCACALMNLRVAAAAQRLHLECLPLPDPVDEDCLARVTVTGMSPGPVAEAALLPAIEGRRTFRARFEARPVPDEAIAAMTAAAGLEGAALRPLVEAAARERVAALVAEGDAVLWANPAWRRELSAWMHPRRRGDGLTVPALALPLAQMVVRTFDMGGGVAAHDKELADASPLLAVLTTEGDDVRSWLRAGQALQRVLLVACGYGLQASYLNQPIQVAALRPKLRQLAGGGMPQILLRIGHAGREVPPSARRPLEDVVEIVNGSQAVLPASAVTSSISIGP